MTFDELLARWLDGTLVPPVAALVGIRLVAASPGEATCELEVEGRHFNPMGTVHGGIFADLADAAMGVAVASSLTTGETFTTLDLHVSYLRPVRSGRLSARARIVHKGKTAVHAECEVLDGSGRPAARASCACLVLPSR